MSKITDTPAEETRTLQAQTRAAEFAPSTLNMESRTVDVVWTTGAVVRRYGWDESYDEELVVDPASVRLDRLNAGAPLLADHNTYTGIRGQIGVVEKAWLADGKGYATVRFSAREDVAPIIQDVADGILRSISVGYRVHKFERTSAQDRKGNGKEVPLYRAVDWEPKEISIVSIPADVGAVIRAQEDNAHPVQVTCMEGEHTTQETQTRAAQENTHMATQPTNEPGAAAEVRNQPSADVIAAEAIRAERTRAAEIRSRFQAAGLEGADVAIERGDSVEAASASIFAALAARSAATPTVPAAPQANRLDADETRAAAIQNAIAHRAGADVELTDAAREYRGLSLAETARQFLAERGERVRGLAPAEVVRKAFETRAVNETGDFPKLLGNVASRSLRQAYEAAPQTWRPLVRVMEVPNFKDNERISLSGFPEMLPVAEGAPYAEASLGDSFEKYRISRFGRVINITRQAVINDDLSAFSRIPMLYGAAAADCESDLFWNLFITDLTLMQDGNPLFHEDHNNILPAASLTVDNIGAARAALRKQRSPEGKALNLASRFLIVGSDNEHKAYKATGAIAPASADQVNPNANLQVISEARIDAMSGTPWFLATAPGRIDTAEFAYLEGARGLQTETRREFETDNVQVKAFLECGVGLLEHRWVVGVGR